MKKLNIRDVVGGLIVATIGLVFLIGALDMRIGSAMSMGPGYFPVLAGGLVILLGLVIGLTGSTSSTVLEEVHWQPMLAVLAAVAAFALMLDQFGLVPATIVGSLVSSLGDRTSKLLPSIMLAIGTAIAAWLIFRVGLGLQMPGAKLPDWLG